MNRPNGVQVPVWIVARIGFGALAGFTFVTRLMCLPVVRESNLTPDGARFLNIARCIGRGQGFATPEAWPAWMSPASLPMPETFKEPGYPYAIAALTRLTHDPFRAAQDVSFLAGLLLPFAVLALGRRLSPGPLVGVVAALLCAASPLMIQLSSYAMAESVLALMLTLAFLAAAPRVAAEGAFETPGAARPADFLAGACFGLAFLIRAQTALALPALGALLLVAASGRVRLARVALAALGAAIAVLPLVVRNLRLFGAPFHSDVAAFGLWPYVDQFALVHSLERPPSATAYALAHLPEVARHLARGAVDFVRGTLWRDLMGSMLWLVPLGVGGWAAARRWRVWGFAILLVVPTALFILSLNWVARYFASVVPILCLIAGLGVAAIVRRMATWEFARKYAMGFIVPASFPLFISADKAIENAGPTYTPEIVAARSEAPFLRAHLAPGEAVMAEMTSYWAWWSDRPAVYPVVADSARFTEVMRRLRVRYAALPTSRLAEFASRYPGGRLPAALKLDHEDRERDVTVFELRP